MRGVKGRAIFVLSSVMHGDDGSFSDIVSSSFCDDFNFQAVIFLGHGGSFSQDGGTRLQLNSVGEEEVIEVMSIFSFRASRVHELIPGNVSAFPEFVLFAGELLGDEVLFFAGSFSPFFNIGVRIQFSEDHPV